MKTGRAILQIVPRSPGGRDGVGDYARTLALRLREVHQLETTFLAAAASSVTEIEGFRVLSPIRKTSSELAPNDAAIILHFVNYGYDHRGIPLWLPGVVHKLGGSRRLLTIFHELYASGSWRQSAFWLGPVQRHIARTIAKASDVALVSSETLREQLQSLAPQTRIIVHPVFSNFGEPERLEVTNRPPGRWVICGGTELIERSLRSFLEIADSVANPWRPRELIVLGGTNNPRIHQVMETGKTIRIHYHPEVNAKEASDLLASCAFAWIDYFVRRDVATTAIFKSTAFAACCAHGVIPVFPFPGSTLSLGGRQLPGPFFVDRTGQNLPSEAEYQSVARMVHSWYQCNSSSRHLTDRVAAALREPGQP